MRASAPGHTAQGTIISAAAEDRERFKYSRVGEASTGGGSLKRYVGLWFARHERGAWDGVSNRRAGAARAQSHGLVYSSER